MKGPPDGALTRWERMRLLLLQMKELKGLTLEEIHRFLMGHFGLKKETREEYIEDLKDSGFIRAGRVKLHVTPIAYNHFKLGEQELPPS